MTEDKPRNSIRRNQPHLVLIQCRIFCLFRGEGSPKINTYLCWIPSINDLFVMNFRTYDSYDLGTLINSMTSACSFYLNKKASPSWEASNIIVYLKGNCKASTFDITSSNSAYDNRNWNFFLPPKRRMQNGVSYQGREISLGILKIPGIRQRISLTFFDNSSD